MSGIFDSFSETAKRFPNLPSLQMKGEDGLKSFTFKDISDRAVGIGRYLSSLGIKKGDRVAIFSENCPEWGIAYLGIVSIGAVAVPLDAQYTKDEVENLLIDSESRAIFASKALLPIVEEVSQGLNIKIIRLDKPLPENPPSSYPLGINPFAKGGEVSESPFEKGGFRGILNDDLASLLYTSGTTGVPKGVMLTHGNLLSNADAIIESRIVTHDDHVLGILPLHHTYPFMVCFLVPLLGGGKVTYLNSLKGPDIVKAIREEGVTVLVGVPQLYALMRKVIIGKIESLSTVKRLISKGLFLIARETRKKTGLNVGKLVFKKVHNEFGKSLRFFASGGARLDPAIAFDMEGIGFTMLEGYGLTETSPVVTFNLPGKKNTGSVGRAINQVQIEVENPDSSGIGEVVIKGPNVMKGYYRNPVATAEVVTAGCFHSGDLGYIDSDGYLFITGRSKEVIVLSSGKNVYPEDVESHYQNSPYIKEICVIGIPDPDHPESFVGIKALIFPNYERLAADGIANISDQIKWQIEKLSVALPAYKRASGFSILKEPLPRTHLGKIRRFMVRDEEAGAALRLAPVLSDEEQRLMETYTGKAVLHAISTITSKKVFINSNLELDLGIDSLGRVELVVALENGLGVSIPQAFSSEVATVKDVILMAAECANGESDVEALRRPVFWHDILMKLPPEEIIKRIGLRRGVIGDALLRFVLWLIYLLSRVFFRLEVRGAENMPEDGACIIAPNHVSLIDGFVVGSIIRKRLPRLYAMGFRGFFQGPLASRLGRWSHVIIVDADSGLSESLPASAYALRQGVALIVFPEGGRSVDGRILPFKKGVGILAKELNVPMIPTYIEGTLDVLPRGTMIPRLKKITVTFGRPLTAEDIEGLDYQQIADRLREKVVSIKG